MTAKRLAEGRTARSFVSILGFALRVVLIGCGAVGCTGGGGGGSPATGDRPGEDDVRNDNSTQASANSDAGGPGDENANTNASEIEDEPTVPPDGGANVNANSGTAGPPQPANTNAGSNTNSGDATPHEDIPRGIVIDQHLPGWVLGYAIYLPTGYPSLTDLPVVVSCHGTLGTGLLQMGPTDMDLAFGGSDFGGPLWPELAESYGLVVVCPTFRFGNQNPDGSFDYSICAALDAANFILAILADLEQRGLAGTERYITGHSSGASLAFTTALRNAGTFRAAIMRHSHVGLCCEPDYPVFAALDYNLNVAPFLAHAYDENGVCQQLTNPLSAAYEWKTDAQLKQIAIHVISSSGEGLDLPPAYSFAANNQLLFDALVGQLGYDPALLTQEVFTLPEGQHPFYTCTATEAPDYPHFCHAQDRDLTAEWIVDFRAQN